MDVTSNTSDLKRNIDVVHLSKGDLFVEPCTFILLAPEVVGQKLSLGDLSEHPSKFVLHQLVRSDWVVELNSRKCVSLGAVEAGHCCTECAPRDSEASVIQAGERSAQSLDARKNPVFWNLAVLEHKFACD